MSWVLCGVTVRYVEYSRVVCGVIIKLWGTRNVRGSRTYEDSSTNRVGTPGDQTQDNWVANLAHIRGRLLPRASYRLLLRRDPSTSPLVAGETGPMSGVSYVLSENDIYEKAISVIACLVPGA